MTHQSINSYTSKGLFNADVVPFVALEASGPEQTFDVSLGGGKDPVTMLIDIPSSGSGVHKLFCIGKNGNEKEVLLTGKKLNVVHLTTHGFVDENGVAKFRYYTDNTDGISMIGIKVCVIKYIPVVNN